MFGDKTKWPGWRADLFDPRKVPLSIAESFLCVSWLGEDQAFWLRNLRGGDEHTNQGRLLRLVLPKSLMNDARLFPDALEFSGEDGSSLQVAFLNAETLVIKTVNCAIRMQSAAGKYDYVQQDGAKARISVARQDLQCEVIAQEGTLHASSNWNGLSSDQIEISITPRNRSAEAMLRVFRVEPAHITDAGFEAARNKSGSTFKNFDSRWPVVSSSHGAGRLLASCILWSALVPAEGVLTRPAIFTSKNGMNNIWSWDNCFVALGLALQDPKSAFDQMAVIFDAQHTSGRLPDFVNDRYSYWSFTKPPVHGWTFAQLRAMSPTFYDAATLKTIADWLERQAESWLAGPSYDGLPAYRHGNDAGWDNATVFAEGGPVVTPDLATFLCLTLDEVAACCDHLGLTGRAEAAKARSRKLLDDLVRVLWTGERFVSRLQSTGKIVDGGNALLAFMPLLLGQRLPHSCAETMLGNLKKPSHFLTGHGLATEALDSAHYKSDGYWRGPIWAPTTALLIAALDACGETAFANELAKRFCDMATHAGMAENFDAVTGEGLSDAAFAWTSAVFMTLARRLANAPKTPIENDFIVR
jgi:putative isomerase